MRWVGRDKIRSVKCSERVDSALRFVGLSGN